MSLLYASAAFAQDSCSDVFSSATNGNTSFSLTPLVSSGNNNISTGNNGSIVLAAGQNHDYDSITANNGFTVTVSGSGTARLHLTGTLDLNNNAQINAGGNPEDLVIYVNGNVIINNGATINALIYANGNISINNNGSTNGALAANGNINIGSHTVTYIASAVSSADFAGMCSASVTSCGESVADNFANVSYSQNDGSENWSTNWLEVNESDGPSAGISRVRSDRCSAGNCLRLGVPSGGASQSYSNIGVQREVDLSGSTGATLSFNHFAGVAFGSATVTLSVSDNGGANWTNLQTFNITGSNATATPFSVDISGFAASNTRIRFLTSSAGAVLGMYIDDIRVDYNKTCSPPTTPSPIADWRMDELGWDGTSNEVVDSSTNGFDGTAFGTSTTTGFICNAADLRANGTSDYLVLDNRAMDGLTDFTVSAWVQTTNNGNQPILSGSTGSQHNELIWWWPNGSTFQPFLKGGSSGGNISASVNDGNWHHVVWTRSGTQNCLYVDGAQQGSCVARSAAALSITSGGLIMGQEQDSLGGGFSATQEWEGLVDETLVFDSSLSAAEIGQIYANQSAGNNWDGSARSCPVAITPLLDLRMEELSWSGSAGEVSDSSGNGFNGTAVNGAQTDSSTPAVVGNPGTCRYGEFDGVDDHITLGNPAALNFAGQITLAAWIRPDRSDGLRNIIAHGHRFSPNQEIIFRINNGLYQAGSWNGTDHITSASIPAGDVGSGQWVHLASTYDGSAWRLYRNGVLVDTQADPVGAIQVSENWAIGGRGTGTERFFDGGIDEARVYDTALSESEIQQVMAETHSCLTQPVLDWHMDETGWNGTAGEINDSSGNNNNGTATGATTTTGLLCNGADLTPTSTSDYLSMSGQVLDGLGDFSISVWGRSSNSAAQAIVSGSSGSQHNELIMWFPNASIFQPYLKGSGSGGNVSTGGSTSDGNWHHYVWTREGAQNCLYIDGVSRGCVSRSSATLSIANNGLVIGQEQDSLGGSFDPGQDWEGLLDELIIFDSAIDAPTAQQIYNNQLAGNNWDGSTRTCPAGGPARLDIVVSGAGSTCVAKDVELRACADAACSSLYTSYTGIVNLSTSTNHGSWTTTAANGTLIPGAADSGVAAFTFAAGNAGAVTLQLNNTHAETLSVDAVDAGDSSLSDSETLTFSDNAFVINDSDPLPGSDVPVAGRDHRYQVQMYRRDTSQSPPNCAVATGYNNASQSIRAWVTRNGLVGAAAPSIAGVALPDTGSATITLDFSAGGEAEFYLTTSDVGRYSINLLDDFNGFAGVDITGASNEQIVRPFGFNIGIAGVAFSTDANGPVFTSAGTPFETTITATNWQSTDDTNNDGLPDAGADLSNNLATVSFGQEPTPEAVVLTHSLVLPSPGDSGTLANGSFSGFFGGQARNDISWSEVGIIDLAAALTDSDYLGSGIAITGRLDNVGRFTPAHYHVSGGSAMEACTIGASFTYMDQDFDITYDVEARNAFNLITSNYVGGFIKLDTASTLTAGAVDGATNLTARLDPFVAVEAATNFDWLASGTNGLGELTTTFSLSRSAALTGPYTMEVGVRVTDNDGISSTNLNLDVDGGGADYTTVGTSNQRYGRLFLENALGPETRALDVPFTAQYYDSSAGEFVSNSADNCTRYIRGDFSEIAGTYTLNLDPSETDPVDPVSATDYVNGTGFMTLSAPGANQYGSVDIQYSVPAYLQFDWDGDSLVDNDPVSTATFGSYRGNDRIIYRQEVLR